MNTGLSWILRLEACYRVCPQCVMSKGTIVTIISGHLNVFKDDSGRVIRGDYVAFFGIPLGVALALSYLHIIIEKDAAAFCATSLSIFAALLFNLIVLIVDMARKSNEKLRELKAGGKDSTGVHRLTKKINLLKQLNSTVGFEIILSVLALIILLALTIPSPKNKWINFNHGQVFASGLAFFLVTCFVTHLFLILRRLYVLLGNELEP